MVGWAKDMVTVKQRPTSNMPMSVSSLADVCGVSRQRIYNLVKEGFINAVPMAGGFVIMPQEVQRILKLKTDVRIKGGKKQVRFNFGMI
jgi:hypothetical protein